jgi:hypothetical protein
MPPLRQELCDLKVLLLTISLAVRYDCSMKLCGKWPPWTKEKVVASVSDHGTPASAGEDARSLPTSPIM